MNIYQKIQEARVKLQNMNLKKSGKNSFAGYDYFELQDYLPHVNNIFNEIKLFSQVTFTKEEATLTIINAEKPDEKVTFTSPMADVSLKGVHPIQNLGAVQSYQRRYLYQAALEITESDALDATTGKAMPQSGQAPQGNKLSDKQETLIHGKVGALAKKLGVNKEQLLQRMNIQDVSKLTAKQASSIIDSLVKMEKQA